MRYATSSPGLQHHHFANSDSALLTSNLVLEEVGAKINGVELGTLHKTPEWATGDCTQLLALVGTCPGERCSCWRAEGVDAALQGSGTAGPHLRLAGGGPTT